MDRVTKADLLALLDVARWDVSRVNMSRFNVIECLIFAFDERVQASCVRTSTIARDCHLTMVTASRLIRDIVGSEAFTVSRGKVRAGNYYKVNIVKLRHYLLILSGGRSDEC